VDAEKPLSIARPPKPVSEMTEAELDAWANEVYGAFDTPEQDE
jgi:hypothetical protein